MNWYFKCKQFQKASQKTCKTITAPEEVAKIMKEMDEQEKLKNKYKSCYQKLDY